MPRSASVSGRLFDLFGDPAPGIPVQVSAISTTRRSEIDWLYRGAGRFFPEAWQRFRDGAGEDDVVGAYARLMADPDRREDAAVAWMNWEETVLSLEPGATAEVHSGPPDDALLAFVRLTTHYYAHSGWLEEGAVIRDAGRLAGIPGVLLGAQITAGLVHADRGVPRRAAVAV